MAQAKIQPTPNTPTKAIEALEADLPKVLQGKLLEEVGWKRPDNLTLLIPMEGVRPDGKDHYLLKLGFLYYPEWPPSALFVNPETCGYTFPDDVAWLPNIEGAGELAVHKKYRTFGQLICASVTLEFYQVLHSVEPRHVWDHSKQNFSATIAAIQWALRSPFYKGRQKP